MAGLVPAKQDERYGFPVRITSPKGETLSGFYITERESPEGQRVSYISSIDPALDLTNAQKWGRSDGREALIAVPPSDVIFLDPPPEGREPEQIRYINGIMFIDGLKDPLKIVLFEALRGKFAPTQMEIIYNPSSRQVIHIEALYSQPTEYGKILLINTIKRLGLKDLTVIQFSLLSPPFIGGYC